MEGLGSKAKPRAFSWNLIENISITDHGNKASQTDQAAGAFRFPTSLAPKAMKI